ncbi:hypothetical protein EDF61_11416 [Arthrobacter sp. JUb115]|nr:hypothetical protein EDF61_11416 [Arthrobacter sp. JUb115]
MVSIRLLVESLEFQQVEAAWFRVGSDRRVAEHQPADGAQGVQQLDRPLHRCIEVSSHELSSDFERYVYSCWTRNDDQKIRKSITNMCFFLCTCRGPSERYSRRTRFHSFWREESVSRREYAPCCAARSSRARTSEVDKTHIELQRKRQICLQGHALRCVQIGRPRRSSIQRVERRTVCSYLRSVA